MIVIDNYTLHEKKQEYEVEIYFHLIEYQQIFLSNNNLFLNTTFNNIINYLPFFDKLQVTFITNTTLIVPKTTFFPPSSISSSLLLSQQYYYHKVHAIIIEQGKYMMMIRFECGQIDFMNINTYCLSIGSNINIESRGIVNNFTIDINDKFLIKSIFINNSNYCTATQAFHGRFDITTSEIDNFDEKRHDGDIYTLYQPYQCMLQDIYNLNLIINRLNNHHIIFLGDSTHYK